MSMWMMLAVGCAGEEPGALYRQASEMVPEEALPVCLEIGDLALQGECLSFAAVEALGRAQPELAQQICAAADSDLWREECVFLLADRRERLRAEAAEDCAQAGRFISDCLSHALERDYRMLPDDLRRPGGEAALLAELNDMATHYGEGGESDGALLMAHIIARRVGPGPLHMKACGQVPPEVCHTGFLIALSIPGPGIDRAAACQEPRSADTVAAAGLRPWTPEAERAGRLALSTLCEAVASGIDPGRLGELIGETPTVPMGTHFLLPPPWRPGIGAIPWDDGI